MNRITNFHLLLFVMLCNTIVFFASCQEKSNSATEEEGPFTKANILKVQDVFGLDFNENEIDTMLDYLERNLRGYDTLRTIPIGNEVAPALYFDPKPQGFRVNTKQQRVSWPSFTPSNLPTESEELAFYSVGQLANLLRSQKLTSEALTQIYIERIKKYDPILKATITLLETEALEQARQADREIKAGNYRGPLHGIPYGIKDLFALKGHPTTWGAMPYKDQLIDYNAAVIEKLEAAGAILVAKLTSGALARGDVWYGGRTLNPWDTLQGASGSSAGSASATAAGLVAFSIGTETLGSITSPSRRCGVTGLRPTFGRVSRYGCMTLSWSMDKIGPICRTANDCALVFDAIHGLDSRDRTTLDAAFNYRPNQSLGKLKIGFLQSVFERDTSEAQENYANALQEIEKLGIELTPVTLPQTLPYRAFDVILRSESGAFFDALVRNNGDDQLVQQNKSSRANSLRQSRFIPAVEYIQANRHRNKLIEAMQQLMENVDLIIAPPGGSPQLIITNLTGHPAIALPIGLDAEGHPASITFIGKLYDEATLLALAHQLQSTTNYEELKPPLFSAKSE